MLPLHPPSSSSRWLGCKDNSEDLCWLVARRGWRSLDLTCTIERKSQLGASHVRMMSAVHQSQEGLGMGRFKIPFYDGVGHTIHKSQSQASPQRGGRGWYLVFLEILYREFQNLFYPLNQPFHFLLFIWKRQRRRTWRIMDEDVHFNTRG